MNLIRRIVCAIVGHVWFFLMDRTSLDPGVGHFECNRCGKWRKG